MIEAPDGYYLIKKEDYDNLLTDYAKLLKRVSELEARLNKNSQNSSKPPSSDGLKRVIKNNRESTERNPGGQPDHPGHNLKMVAQADTVVRLKLEGYCSCGEDLTQTPLSHLQRRQIFDIPAKLFEVTEYQVEIKKCKCGKVHEAPCEVSNHVQYGSRFKSLMIYLNQYQFLPFERLQEFCKDCFGISISDGFLEQTNKNCYENLAQTEAGIKAALLNSVVIHNDETGIRCQGKTQWIHDTSSLEHTLYSIHEKRGIEAMNEIGILNQYQGIAVHDRWASYDQYNFTHSLCNAHLLRDLKFLNEEMKCKWAGKMKVLLVKANDYKKEEQLNEMLIEDIENQYISIIQEGLAELPKEAVPKETKRGRKAKSKSELLLNVFSMRSQDVLMFIYNPEVPFDNNLAERDLRMIKLKQKISGCFRSENGAKVFCRIRSYISTIRKQGHSVLDAIHLAVNNKPIIVWQA